MKDMTIDEPKRLEIIIGRIIQYIHSYNISVDDKDRPISLALGDDKVESCKFDCSNE